MALGEKAVGAECLTRKKGVHLETVSHKIRLN